MTTTTPERPAGLSDATRDILRHVSIATVATLLFKRGLRNQCIQDVHPLGRKTENMVGSAFTLRYIPAREDLNGIEVFRDPEHPQRAGVEAAPKGSVMVMDSRKDPRAASAGSILVTRLMARDVEGVVTDGGFRDSPEIAELAIHAYHNRPSAPTNLTLHQALEFDVPIGCGDVAVWPGDIMLGDGEGIIVIPHAIVDEVAAEAAEMTVYEDFVLEQVQGGATIIGLYPSTKEENKTLFAEWRNKTGR